MTDRYTTSHLIEDQYEPGSDGKVLRNLLGITSQEEMEIAETAGEARGQVRHSDIC